MRIQSDLSSEEVESLYNQLPLGLDRVRVLGYHPGHESGAVASLALLGYGKI